MSSERHYTLRDLTADEVEEIARRRIKTPKQRVTIFWVLALASLATFLWAVRMGPEDGTITPYTLVALAAGLAPATYLWRGIWHWKDRAAREFRLKLEGKGR